MKVRWLKLLSSFAHQQQHKKENYQWREKKNLLNELIAFQSFQNEFVEALSIKRVKKKKIDIELET